MPDPLASDVVTRLKSDPTAALAAALILAGAFPALVSWAMRAVGGKDGKPSDPKKASGGSRGNGVAMSDGARRRAGAKGGHAPRQAAAKHDEALLELMRANPGASITEIIRKNGRPRNSTVASLKRVARHAADGQIRDELTVGVRVSTPPPSRPAHTLHI
jgi:hypothetical protein